jgi:hypothetical protein
LVALAGAILVATPPQAPGVAVRLVAAGPWDDGAAERVPPVPAARKAIEIEAAFGVRLVCPVDEFNASAFGHPPRVIARRVKATEAAGIHRGHESGTSDSRGGCYFQLTRQVFLVTCVPLPVPSLPTPRRSAAAWTSAACAPGAGKCVLSVSSRDRLPCGPLVRLGSVRVIGPA